MSIIACGLNHKTAPINLREKIYFSAEKLSLYLQDLVNQDNIREAVLLSTCNRSELYCEADNAEKVLEWFYRQYPLPQTEIEPAVYCYQDQAAIEHMMKVACGVDSMILGESQILGQMKNAFSESCAQGAVNSLFQRLFQNIFAVAKEVRTTTSIGACPVSVASSAIALAKQIIPESFLNKQFLIVGAGDTAHLLLRHLHSQHAKKITVINRKVEKAKLLADKYHVQVAPYSALLRLLEEVDVVFTATGSTFPIITKKNLQAITEERQSPLYLFDIAVPRDIESQVTELSNVYLQTIDDLKTLIEQNRQGREHAADKAKELIHQKSHAFMVWLHSLEKISATIRVYRQQIEEICQIELMKAQKKLQRGENPSEVLLNFSHAFTKKLLHTPSVQLRQAGFEGRFELLQWAQQLFAIPEPL